MRIALIEPYYGGSHKAWADGYREASRNDVALITHPARFWKWRMHGGFLTLANELRDEISINGAPDVILASSMMNVAAFAGAVREVAKGVPIAVYFHESQFTYPLSPADRPDDTYKMMNWASAAVADSVIFNSEFHRTLFREEAHRYLNSLPEYKHNPIVESVLDSSIVLPVGIDTIETSLMFDRGDRAPLILWNQRWEHDKGPDELLSIVTGLVESGIDFEMAMCGEVFVSVPALFSEVTEMLNDRLIHEGWAERDRYVELLDEASVVLSTAHQEFFGVGVTEAVAHGAHPVFPDRLVYPERVADFGVDPERSLYGTTEEAVDLIIEAVAREPERAVADAARAFSWDQVAPLYDEYFEGLA